MLEERQRVQMEALASALGRAESNFAMTSAVQRQPATAAAGHQARWTGPAMRHSGAGGVVAETLRKLIENDYARQWVQAERGPAARALMSGLARLLTHPTGSSDALVRTMSSHAHHRQARDRQTRRISALVHAGCWGSPLLCPRTPKGLYYCVDAPPLFFWLIGLRRNRFAHALNGVVDPH